MPHFYSMTFLDSQNGETIHANAYVGIPEPKVTRKAIAAGRQTAGVGPAAVLLAAAYLGEMTAEEWQAGDD
ncbi:TPA: hypothetical protein ACKP0L_003825 [Pseudomonas putida]